MKPSTRYVRHALIFLYNAIGNELKMGFVIYILIILSQ